MKIKKGDNVTWVYTHLIDENPQWPLTFNVNGVVLRKYKNNAFVRFTKHTGAKYDRWVFVKDLKLKD